MSEILMVPFHGQGHLFPCSELCKHLASRNYRITFLIPSSLFSSISSSLCQHSLVQIAQLPVPTPSPDSDPMHNHGHMAQSLSDFLSSRSDDPDYLLPVCAVVDVMMSWTTETFQKFKIPIVSFFTSGACSAAMEYALWKLQPLPEKLTPGDTLIIPGLPEDMCFTCSDLTHKDQPPPPHHRGDGPPSSQQHGRGPPPSSQQHGGGPPPPHHRGGGFPPPPGPPPIPGHRPPWVSETEDSIALLMNTCDDLERPFIDYVANQTGKPVWGVGPLLPEQYWRSADSLVHDRDIRSKRESNVTEEEVSEWLDSKPRQSVIYVSFGSEVCPTAKELAELAEALDKSSQPFIWVVQSNLGKPGPPGGPPGPHGGPPDDGDGGDFSPDDLASRAEGRGLIIRGWAPQLLILSHPSTAGFITHCGWNSIVEAIGRGVPLLAWPIRGDQPFNAKLIVTHLKVGLMIQGGDQSEPIRKDDILNGIEKLMADKETRKRAASLRTTFDHGFPPSSVASLDAFRDFISENC